jgi:hypothetical protein
VTASAGRAAEIGLARKIGADYDACKLTNKNPGRI